MIKYLELTAPESSEFRQAKILSVEVNEGDSVEIGDTLFRVKSGKNDIDLPSTMAGNVTEVIALVGENISIMTPLLLLETEVDGSTATPPINPDAENETLDSSNEPSAEVENKEPSAEVENKEPSADKKPAKSKAAKKTKKKAKKKASKKKASKKARKKAAQKPAQQQSLNLDGEETEEFELESEELLAQESETELMAEEQPKDKTIMSNIQVTVPDIGADSAKVIEILVKVGDSIEVDDPIITLESDKASMDVPSPHAGVISSIAVTVDQDASEGTVILELEASDAAATDSQAEQKVPAEAPADTQVNEAPAKAEPAAPQAAAPAVAAPPAPAPVSSGSSSHASPSIRRFARELGANLGNIQGSGRKGRITKDDVKAYVKGVLANPGSAAPAAGSGIPEIPAVDFSKFGEIDVQPLNSIKRITATNLHRSWVNVPHVTHHDESNISDLEDFRKQLNAEYKASGKGTKLSPLAFIVKAVVRGMQAYPQFNSSIEPGGKNLIYKKYFNIGIAVDTPNGLVVPVIKDADKKSVSQIAQEMGELAAKARDKKLTMADMSGGCFTISSLGGIGGTKFSPIVNAPEVAILGVSRSQIKPIWNGSEFVPGTMLPLSLSYDHRVIDGAEGARFARHIAEVLEDVRRLTV